MENIKLTIPYGNSIKLFEIQKRNLLAYIKPILPKHPDPYEEENEIKKSILNPTDCDRLKDMCDKNSKVLIIVDDWTRPTPAYKIIPLILNELKEANVDNKNVLFIIARGTHRKPLKDELSDKLGKEVIEKFPVKIHDCEKKISFLGKTSRGTPIWINEEILKADVKISIGSVIPHPLAGYGGGAKIITPGVSGRETIHYNHSLINNPNATIGITDGNPIREDMEEIAEKAGLDFSINLILDDKKGILKAFCGHFIKAHREAVKAYEKFYGFNVYEEADILILGSYPRDATFGHATFALYSAMRLVKEGGTIILVAPCINGPGSRLERFAFKEVANIEPEELIKLIKEGKIDASGGAFDYCYSKVLKRNKIVLVSDNYTHSQAKELGVEHTKSIQEGLENALKYHGKDAKVAVVPLGGMTIPLKITF